MRVTVCELPHEPVALAAAWARLCEHTWQHESELVLLPEFAMVEPVWEEPHFEPARWDAVVALSEQWTGLLGELHARHVVGTRPANVDGLRLNQGYLATAGAAIAPLRHKYFFPNEPGGWEGKWFDRGDRDFPLFRADDVTFGLNICTEMWSLDSYSAYAELGAHLVLCPRATAADTIAKWLSVGVVGAVRSGAFAISSNRVDDTGTYGGAGWIVSPDGQILARTTAGTPFVTVDINVAEAVGSRESYPRYVFEQEEPIGPARIVA